MEAKASTTGENTSMTFNSLKQTNKKLSQNPELSQHNKEVLEDFFRKARSGGAGDPTLRDYASRFNKLALHIDFKLDQATQRELEDLTAKFNTDKIRKNNGEKYSDYSKNKFWKTISKFYTGFIKREGKGYNEDIDGEELLEDLKINVDISTQVDPDSLPTPKQVRKVANHANSLRDKAVILLGWASGARVGEIFKTQYNEEPLTWSEITFEEDKLWIELDGKTGKREVPVKTSMPVMKDLWEESNTRQEDPVFMKKNSSSICPECGKKLKLKQGHERRTYENREYSCEECGWKGKSGEVKKQVEPLTDSAVRRIIERCAERAGLENQFDLNPHDFFRKSRAMYKVRIGYTEHRLRAFFGWSETSDAPKHYIQCIKEDLEKAFKEEFGEEIEENDEYEDALRPVECVSCGMLNSSTRDICKECENPLTEQGQELTRDEGTQKFEKGLGEIAEQQDLSQEELQELFNMPFNEAVKKLFGGT